jgi:uncharacterized membrane protein
MTTEIVRHRIAHWRVGVAAAAGTAAGVLAWDFDTATRALIGWNVGALVLLGGILHTVTTVGLAELKRIAAKEDEAGGVLFALMLGAIGASLFGVVVEIGAAKEASAGEAVLYTALGISTLILSWLMMHSLFALHYAHRYYGDRDKSDSPDGGLGFPKSHGRDAGPGYPEFVYFSFCVGMTFQTSDVSVLTRAFRRNVTVHAVLSFFYNIFILGLAVNLFAAFGSR